MAYQRKQTSKIDITGMEQGELFTAMRSSKGGLSSKEAEMRLSQFGQNSIIFHQSSSPLLMLGKEFLSLFPLMLLVASVLAFLLTR